MLTPKRFVTIGLAFLIALVVTPIKHWRSPAIQTGFALCTIAALMLCGVPLPAHAGLVGFSLIGAMAGTEAGTASASVQSTFKQIYTEVVDAVPESNVLTAQLNRTTKVKAGPDGVYFNTKLQRGGPTANVREGRMLPRPGKPTRKKGKADLVHSYTSILIGGQSIALTDSKDKAFVSNMEDQFEDAMFRMKDDVERQYNFDGRGVLCVLEAVGAAPTYAAQYPGGVTTPAGAPGTLYLVEDMDVTFINPGTGLERGRSTINSIDVAADTFTTAGAIAGAAIGDYVSLCNDVGAAGADQDNNYTREASGILAVVKSGDTFENIDGAANRRWNGTYIDGGAGVPSEKKLAVLERRIKALSGEKPDFHYTTPGLSLEMQDQLAALRRFTGETVELKGGYEGLKLGTRTVAEGDFCPKGHWFALSTKKKNVGMLDLIKLGWVDDDGAVLARQNGYHTFRGDMYVPHNVIWYNRAAQGAYYNFADDLTIRR